MDPWHGAYDLFNGEVMKLLNFIAFDWTMKNDANVNEAQRRAYWLKIA